MHNNSRHTELKEVFRKYLQKNTSKEEEAFVEEYYAYFDKEMYDPQLLSPEVHKALGEKIFVQLSERMEKETVPDVKSAADISSDISVVHRVHFLRRGFFRYAAAALIIICGVGGYFLMGNKKTERSLTSNNGSLQTDIPPGGDKAVLTLADGRVILLDSAANGNLAQQGNAAIIKLANGQIAYNLKGLAGSDVMMNTMSTPKGGQYQLTLPDGSKVWLNAASSIQFPAAFVGSERKVKITGEVYFEVVQNKAKPFIVDVDGKSTVQVLGTSFNINSYADEGAIKSTLVEGSVSVSNNSHNSVILKPSQQAQINMSFAAVAASSDRQSTTQSLDAQVKVFNNADIEQTLAWKNGIFNFNGLDVRAVMAQLSRWYDINVHYEGAMPSNIFRGKMYRDVKLSAVMQWLQEMGVKCRMDGKTVIVM